MVEYEELSPKFREALISKVKTASPFWELLGMDLVDVKKGWARVRLPFAEKLTNALVVAHGGAIFSVADSAVALALIGLVDRRETFTTIEMKINFLRPFDGREITAEARIISKGNRTALGDVDVWDAEGRLVAKGLATYMIQKQTGAPDAVSKLKD